MDFLSALQKRELIRRTTWNYDIFFNTSQSKFFNSDGVLNDAKIVFSDYVATDWEPYVRIISPGKALEHLRSGKTLKNITWDKRMYASMETILIKKYFGQQEIGVTNTQTQVVIFDVYDDSGPVPINICEDVLEINGWIDPDDIHFWE